MSHVDTVRGPISLAELGTVLMHEHVFVLSEDLRRARPDQYDEDSLVAGAVERLTALKATGVDTIVDPTVLGLGRDIELVARVNAAADINIVPATGLYTYNDVPFFLHFHGPGTLLGGDEVLVDLFVRDITEGISGTGIKAAFLKCAIQDTLSPGVERVMVAVAEAHKRTGAPIMVHTSAPDRTGLVAQEVFRREGVDLGNVVIGHSGDTEDLDYLRELVDNGSYLGMDRFGLDILLPTDARVATVTALAGQGLADRMMLAHDASCHFDWFPPGLREVAAPNWHYAFIHDTVIPALREAGVTDEQLHTMLVDNPRRYFEG
ncbi:phosphotriesterase family protein [Kibdelosporangium phytohabitans]|uniref:Phosphotriesterase n=1 Tax=Kibdelosporangium phytohabitans TaxID=860235 RepID=A0A0N9I5R1_9PSEU|nr:phosphotriesterase [Kibdelosporangium phytohabitans]ALG11260.1 phosphotriesterase [Kibdelosporangium phytohabitans]MBE1462548.1 phosphotriesterase-related protein [Kibdelosporangium phytohabitans]